MNQNWRTLGLLLSLCVSVAGCKEGLGDRCESNADCSSGVCSNSTPKICVSKSGETEQIDATLPIDAPLDTAPLDTPRD